MSILYVKICRLLHSSHSHLIVPCLACYELAAKVRLGSGDSSLSKSGKSRYSEPGSVGDISGSCTAKYGKHEVPFAFELYLDQ